MSETKTDKAGRNLGSDTVFMVAHGIFNGWVCAPKHMDKETVQNAVDREIFPAGTSAGWRVESSESEETDHRSPGLCAEDHTRQHWLVVC